MATTESPAASAAEDIKSTERPGKLAKVDKPDEEKFKKDLSEADKQLSVLQERMVPSPPLNRQFENWR